MDNLNLHQKTVKTMAQVMASNHPEILPLMIQYHRLNLSKMVKSFHKNTVAHGPFKGLKLVEESHRGLADQAAMMLGIYEQELLDSLSTITPRRRVFIDLGAAEGYYGVGVLVNDLFQKSYCFEISEQGREIIAKNSEYNNVADRLVIHGEARKDFYQQIPTEDLQDSVLLVDIEGAEFDLFDASVFSGFRNTIIFIELHQWFYKDGEQRLEKLKADASHTHTIKELTMGSRDLSGFEELKTLNDTDRWLMCSEGRGRLMTWLRLDPI